MRTLEFRIPRELDPIPEITSDNKLLILINFRESDPAETDLYSEKIIIPLPETDYRWIVCHFESHGKDPDTITVAEI